MTIFFSIITSILSSFLGFTVYKLIKLDRQLKIEKTRGDLGWKQYHEISDILGIKNSEISSLKKELSSLKGLNAVPVTRIECFQQPIKDIRHTVEINPYDFNHMSDAEIEDMVKKEVFKHIFEAAEPLIELVTVDCPMEMSRKFMGRLKVVEPYKEELK